MRGEKKKISKLAICSLALGVLFPLVLVWSINWSFLVSPWENAGPMLMFAFLLPPVAILLGHLARRCIHHNREAFTGSSLAIAGLLAGYLGLASIPLIVVLNRPSRVCAGFEGMAVGSLRTINAAANGFKASHPEQGFPKTLSELACSKSGSGNNVCLDPTLESGVKAGYKFTYVPQSSRHNEYIDSYEVFADPVRTNIYTMRHFFTDETGTIHFRRNGQSERVG